MPQRSGDRGFGTRLLLCGRRVGCASLLMLMPLSLSGCFSAFDEHPAHARTAASRPAQAGPGEYVIVAGDTLYSIAFRNQLDFHELASWNRIAGPAYKIYPGRVLRLHPAGQATPAMPAPSTAGRQNAEPAATGEPAPVSAGGSSSSPPVAAAASVATVPAISLPPDSAPRPRLPAAPTPVPASTPMTGPRSGRWEWPTRGKVVRGFGADGSKGIDIGGDAGQIVIAASAGKVVYSGSALKGYGELVIIKHDEQYLTAYGYNRRRLVNEGEVVGAGQPIAELGIGPEQRAELHFEIRDKGRPIDPLPLLPPR